MSTGTSSQLKYSFVEPQSGVGLSMNNQNIDDFAMWQFVWEGGQGKGAGGM